MSDPPEAGTSAGPFPTFEVFRGREGEAFTVGGVELALSSATTWGHPWGPGYRQPFTLELVGPAEPWLPQGNYRLSHAEIGELDLFIVPVGPGPGGMHYEIVFS